MRTGTQPGVAFHSRVAWGCQRACVGRRRPAPSAPLRSAEPTLGGSRPRAGQRRARGGRGVASYAAVLGLGKAIRRAGTSSEIAQRLARGWRERGLGRRGRVTGGAERDAEVVAAALNK